MSRDTLFTLPMSFVADGHNRFCLACSELWELIAWFPELKASLEIVHVEIDHSRPCISALQGKGHHNAPTLVLHAASEPVRGLGYTNVKGHTDLASARLIARHFTAATARPSRAANKGFTRRTALGAAQPCVPRRRKFAGLRQFRLPLSHRVVRRNPSTRCTLAMRPPVRLPSSSPTPSTSRELNAEASVSTVYGTTSPPQVIINKSINGSEIF